MELSILEKVRRLQIILTAYSTGEGADPREYESIRAELVESPIATKLPSVVRSYRTLREFWSFIKPKFKKWEERRAYIREQFNPLLSELEGLEDSAESQTGELTTAQLLETAQRAKQLTIDALESAGLHDAAEREYKELRAALLASKLVRANPPEILKSFRALVEFRRYVDKNSPTNDDRYEYIRQQFDPLLQKLEGLGAPVTHPAPIANPAETSLEGTMPDTPGKKSTVFVVYGRNDHASRAMFVFLQALHLKPLEWGHVKGLTGKGSPYIGEILAAGFKAAQAAVVFLTPDDEARLCEQWQKSNDEQYEKELTGQPRQNVLFEAGMAMGMYEDRTILVELGKLRPMTDTIGRHVIRMNDTFARRNDLANSLRTAGCEVNTEGELWQTAGEFNKALEAITRRRTDRSRGKKATTRNRATRSPANKTKSRPPMPSASDLSKEEREVLLERGRPEAVVPWSLAGKVDGQLHRTLSSLISLGLLENEADQFALTENGKEMSDLLWRNTILQFVVRQRGQGKRVTVSSLGTQFGFPVEDGPSKRALMRHLEALRKSANIRIYGDKVEKTTISRQTLREEGLGGG